MSATTQSIAPKPQHRWPQYSLRTLLVLTLALGCGVGWLGYQLRLALMWEADKRALEPLFWRGSDGEQLNLCFSDITDAGLASLPRLPHVKGLWLNHTQVTGVGFDHLRGLARLERLYLDGAPVTDAGLEHLGGLTQLQYLQLDNTQVTDAGLEHLRGLTQLVGLSLKNTPVTDAGVENLRGLTQLLFLDLEGTRVTEAAVRELQKALPNVTTRTLTRDSH